jgi:uncharacterized protein YbjT (DUF2867 family)
MKFVVTGSAGHVSKPLTELLLRKGHEVTVVGRKAENLEMFETLGTGLLFEDIERSKPKVEGLSIEDFAQQFAVAYRQ